MRFPSAAHSSSIPAVACAQRVRSASRCGPRSSSSQSADTPNARQNAAMNSSRGGRSRKYRDTLIADTPVHLATSAVRRPAAASASR